MSAETTGPDARVVVLSRDPVLTAQAAGPLARCLRAPSAYEAAAEALAGHADLLVVDLACLRPAHAGLLRVYRARGLPVLAVGAAPAGLDVEGLQRVSPADLPSAVAAALARPAPNREPAPSEDPETPPRAPRAAHSLISPEELAALLERQP